MYANHSKIHHIAKMTKCYSYPLLFRNLLLDVGNKKLEEKSSKSDIEKITEAVKADALATCNLKKYSSMIHLVALTNVIGYSIVSVYPGAATLVAPFDIFDGMYLPNEQDGAQKAKVTSLYLLWMRDLALDNVSGFTPNHFVPLCFKASRDQGSQEKRMNVEKSPGTVKKKFKLENYWEQGNKERMIMKRKRQKLHKRVFLFKI